MITKIVTYRVRPEALPLVLDTIRRFVVAIQEHEPATRYDAFQYKENPTEFVHTMSFPDPEAERAHQMAAYTAKFVEVLYPNCEVLPRFQDLKEVSQPT